jgi:ferredoxin
VSHTISGECIGCGVCQPECPEQAIGEGEERSVIDAGKCNDCGACVEVCPVGACLPE